MAVIVDDNSYPLNRSLSSQMVYTGTGPVAQNGYYYAKTSGSSILEREPFIRTPVHGDTIYESYNRSQNVWDIPSLPQLYNRLYNRIDTDLHKDGQIGTIHIYGNISGMDFMHANILDDVKVVANMTYIRGSDLLKFEDIEFELAGVSARWVSKLSYNVKIPKGGDTLYGYRRLKLRALAMDPSYIREMVVYKTINAAGVAASDFSYVRLFINDHPVGIYGLIEVYKNPWLRNEFDNGNKDYEQGNLYQARGGFGDIPALDSDLRYIGENVSQYAIGQYKIKEDPSEGEPSFEPMMDLTRFLKNASTASVSEWEQYFDMEALIRNMALEILLGFSDGYFTIANNYYMYQDGLNSKRFIYIPADVDTTLGATLVKLSDMLTGNYSTYPGFQMRPLMPQLLQVPELKDRFEHYIHDLSRRLINPTHLDPLIDATVAMIRQETEWDYTIKPLNTFDWSIIFNNTESIFQDLNLSYPIDEETIVDIVHRKPISFETAVNGPTGYISLCGVKEFIANSSRAIQSFYNM
ncbi:coth protein-domain-containing protein [Zychaea mexicana]|uniref:coth protein-domain-containing protein n=1 Tax=Zychaea mexicana TaxID=64656 RepID=UPI0022FF1C93|nr:coth protein-domain-containing protein [Zychaea mexicana]KAI9498765.1 coth protein-domain-containing protein [Zychaea mexicana]